MHPTEYTIEYLLTTALLVLHIVPLWYTWHVPVVYCKLSTWICLSQMYYHRMFIHNIIVTARRKIYNIVKNIHIYSYGHHQDAARLWWRMCYRNSNIVYGNTPTILRFSCRLLYSHSPDLHRNKTLFCSNALLCCVLPHRAAGNGVRWLDKSYAWQRGKSLDNRAPDNEVGMKNIKNFWLNVRSWVREVKMMVMMVMIPLADAELRCNIGRHKALLSLFLHFWHLGL